MPITVVFDPPLPSDAPAVFNSKAFTTLGDLNDWSTEANALASDVTAKQTTASDAATTATTQADLANSSRIAAQDAAAAAAASYDAFDDRNLGAKASDPTQDNDGAALLEGALYWNTTVKEWRTWNGTAWVTTSVANAVSRGGDTMTGPLEVPAGASGAQVPQAQEIGTLADAQLTTHYKRSNILGTVSQSGGVPTGAIIETGSNANGRYIRFADGTQITHTRFTYLTTSTANQSVTLPATFTSTNYNCFAQAESIASGSNGGSFVAESVASTTSDALVKVLAHTASAVNYLSADINCKLICIGRWF